MHSSLTALASCPGVASISRITAADLESDGLYNFRFVQSSQLSRIFEQVEVYSLSYYSADALIHGFIALPKQLTHKLPLVLFNRGGNNKAENFHCPFPPYRLGRLTAADAVFALGRIATWGYIVAASQYRGCYDLNQGDELGAEVLEIANLRLLLRQCLAVDIQRTAFVAYSRGALGAYLLAAEQDFVRAIVTIGGVTEYPAFKDGKSLSPQLRVSDFDSELKVLLLQGALDSSTPIAETTAMARLLKARGIHAEEVLFPNSTHYLEADDTAAAELTQAWLTRYL